MEAHVGPKRIVADGYDRMGAEFSTWNTERPRDVGRWFVGEVLSRVPPGATVLELGCGPGTDATELSNGRRYVGVDLSHVQLGIARRRVPRATFVLGDLTSMEFRPTSFDGVVAIYVFMHVPEQDLKPTVERIFTWLRPGGWLICRSPPSKQRTESRNGLTPRCSSHDSHLN